MVGLGVGVGVGRLVGVVEVSDILELRKEVDVVDAIVVAVAIGIVFVPL